MPCRCGYCCCCCCCFLSFSIYILSVFCLSFSFNLFPFFVSSLSHSLSISLRLFAKFCTYMRPKIHMEENWRACLALVLESERYYILLCTIYNNNNNMYFLFAYTICVVMYQTNKRMQKKSIFICVHSYSKYNSANSILDERIDLNWAAEERRVRRNPFCKHIAERENRYGI